MGSNHSQSDKDPVPNFSQDNGKTVVKEKLKKLYGKQLVDDNLEKFADILSDKEKLKKVYLHTDFAEAKNLQQSIKNMSFVEPTQDSTKGPMFSSGASEAVASPTTLQMLARKSTDETELGVNSGKNHFANNEEGGDDDIEPQALNTVDPFLDMKNKIRVKLIVAETSRNQLERTLKRVISPFVNMDNHGAPFGFFHIALAVGCWKIEWNSSELCIPRTVTGQASLVCADIESIADLDKLDLVRDKLAEVIVKWNTSIHYKQHGGNPDTDHNGNCQQFIDECLQILNLGSCYTQFPPPLVNYIKKLRKEGYGEMEFEFDDSFKKKFFPDTKPECLEDRKGEPNPFENIYDLYKNKGSIVFKTHDMLDRFVSYLLLVDTQFKYNHKHEFYLLKSFDRAYWMRAIKDPENEIFRPYHSEYGTEACPFSDPQNASILPFVLKK